MCARSTSLCALGVHPSAYSISNHRSHKAQSSLTSWSHSRKRNRAKPSLHVLSHLTSGCDRYLVIRKLMASGAAPLLHKRASRMRPYSSVWKHPEPSQCLTPSMRAASAATYSTIACHQLRIYGSFIARRIIGTFQEPTCSLCLKKKEDEQESTTVMRLLPMPKQAY